MKSAISQLPRVLDMHGVGIQDRSYVLALGLARVIAYQLPLPTSEVEVPLSHFAMQYLDSVNTTLSQINEMVVLNIELTVSLTKKIWLMRYNTVYDMDCVAASRLLDDIIAAGSNEIPPQAREMASKYGNQGLFADVAAVFAAGNAQESIA